MSEVLKEVDSLLSLLEVSDSSISSNSISAMSVIVNDNDRGGPEKLILNKMSIPSPKDNEVLICVKACGVNFIDTYHRSGLYPGVTKIGKEGSGVIIKKGKNVNNFKVGDFVLWWNIQGSYATHIVSSVNNIVMIPNNIFSSKYNINDIFKICASIPLQAFTAHYLVTSIHRSTISASDRVLVHAGAGGTGGLIIQMLRILGCCCIITTVSTSSKGKIALSNGAHHIIIYTKQNFVEEVKRITNGKLCNIVIDGVGKSTWKGSLNCTCVRGTLIYFGNASGAVPNINPLDLTKQGSIMMTRPSLKHFLNNPKEIKFRSNQIFEWIKKGLLKINIGKQLPLKQAINAHRMLEGRQTTGKIVLIP